MDFNQIKNIASTLSKIVDDNEKILISSFAEKLSQASEEYPEDQTIGVMLNVVSRMTGGNKLFITKAEIKDLYKRLYSRNTKFAEIFSHELGQIEKLATPKTYNRDNVENLSLVKEAFEKIVDPTLANALDSIFGNVVRGHTEKAATAAKSICARVCANVKLSSTVDIVNSDNDIIVCKASFETPKGMTSVFLPIEVNASGQAVLPEVFIGNAGPEDLTTKNLTTYIASNAGKKLTVSDKIVLQAVRSIKDNGIEKISNVDMALIKFNSEKDAKTDYFANNVLYQNVQAEDKNLVVNTPKYKDKDIETFAKSFDSAIGVASFSFGKEKVDSGRIVISNKLNSFGLKAHQISVFSSDEKSITYAVSINNGKLAFRVPVNVENGKIIEPNLMIASGMIESFSKDGLNSLNKKEAKDYKTAAVASPLYGLKASELVELVREAVAEENLAKAEDALNVLSESGDDKAYQTAFAEYTNGLSINKVATQTVSCKMVVKNASSKHELCGHTGLPLHKVYQDKNGDCHPLYRRGMDDTYEGAYLQNSKIFF
jgi:hypothetical protein